MDKNITNIVLDIDRNIDRLVKKFELLQYVNPINSETERKKFFASKFNYEPHFRYPKFKNNSFKLIKLLFSQKISRIDDEVVRQLYSDIIYYHSDMIQCINSIGDKSKFYFNSLKCFGVPNRNDVDNAKFILHLDTENEEKEGVNLHDSQYAAKFLEEYGSNFNFDFDIKLSDRISSSAMVLNNLKRLVLKKAYKFSEEELNTLASHEIGVHLVTTFNAINQPLKIFSNGFPNNTETQEGLAVFGEFISGALSLKRLRELAFRVLAVDCLSKGLSFSDTFNQLISNYNPEPQKLFNICLRVYRGGGFTKDHLYLKGLKNVYKRYKSNPNLNTLLMGKVSLEHENAINELLKLGYANPIEHNNPDFQLKSKKDKKMDFILSNLK